MLPSTARSPASACALSTLDSTVGPDRITQIVYDAASEVTQEIRALGVVYPYFPETQQQLYAAYTYTANGQKATVEDANGNRSTNSYDGFDGLVEMDFPSSTTAHTSNSGDKEVYVYDAANNMISKTLRSGDTISYTFDALNREIVKDIPGGTVADVYTSYDLLGHPPHVALRQRRRLGRRRCVRHRWALDLRDKLWPYARFFSWIRQAIARGSLGPTPTMSNTLMTPLNRMNAVEENGATSGTGLLAVYSYDQPWPPRHDHTQQRHHNDLLL